MALQIVFIGLLYLLTGEIRAISAPQGNVSFVRHNWGLCNKNKQMVMLESTIVDYSTILNDTLTALGDIGGGAVWLEAGIYPLNAPVQLPSNTCIVGDGVDRTILQSNRPSSIYRTSDVVYSHSAEHVSLVDLTIDGNQDSMNPFHEYGSTGIHFHNVNYSWFRNVRSINNFLHGGTLQDPCNFFVQF